MRSVDFRRGKTRRLFLGGGYSGSGSGSGVPSDGIEGGKEGGNLFGTFKPEVWKKRQGLAKGSKRLAGWWKRVGACWRRRLKGELELVSLGVLVGGVSGRSSFFFVDRDDDEDDDEDDDDDNVLGLLMGWSGRRVVQL